MQFLQCFARMPQSRVFQRIAAKILSVCKFVVQHPIKALFFIIKLYLSLLLFTFCAVLLLGSFAANANIFEFTPSVPKSTVCVAEYASPPDWPTNHETRCDLNPQKWRNCQSEIIYTTWGAPPCIGEQIASYVRITFDEYKLEDDGTGTGGTVYKYDFSSSYNLGGTINMTGQLQCESPNNVENNEQCYNPQELSDNDSCDTNNPDIIGSASSPALVCNTKSDGSKCVMSKYEVNGQFAYTQNLEPSSCYGGDTLIPDYDTAVNEPDPNQCTQVSADTNVCPADPSVECDPITGQCREGCGSFNIGNGTYFVCLETPNPDNPDPDNPNPGNPNPDDPITGDSSAVEALSVVNNSITNVNNGITNVNEGITNVNNSLEQIQETLSTNKTVSFNQPSDLYTANDYNQKNFGTVMLAAVEEMKRAPIFVAVEQFFDLQIGGTCPTYSTNVPVFGVITIDQFCSAAMTNIWPFIHAIIILVFSVLAFRVAVL